jgi:hypothetical protein
LLHRVVLPETYLFWPDVVVLEGHGVAMWTATESHKLDLDAWLVDPNTVAHQTFFIR